MVGTFTPSITAVIIAPSDTPKPTQTRIPPSPTITPSPTLTAIPQSIANPDIPSEQVQVSYEDRVIRGTLLGDGKTVVILAPIFGTTWAVWMSFAKYLASLSNSALAFDFPGYVSSTWDFSWSKIGSDVSALISYFQQEQGFESVVCVGVSIGGSVCFEAALGATDLSGLVILSAPLEPPPKELLASLTMPKLMIIGTLPDEGHADVEAPMREIFSGMPEPKQLETVQLRGSDLVPVEDDVRDLLVAFLEALK
jgi:pimeloyl-ACP methyl ester carboxylesterase